MWHCIIRNWDGHQAYRARDHTLRSEIYSHCWNFWKNEVFCSNLFLSALNFRDSQLRGLSLKAIQSRIQLFPSFYNLNSNHFFSSWKTNQLSFSTGQDLVFLNFKYALTEISRIRIFFHRLPHPFVQIPWALPVLTNRQHWNCPVPRPRARHLKGLTCSWSEEVLSWRVGLTGAFLGRTLIGAFRALTMARLAVFAAADFRSLDFRNIIPR